MGSVVRVGRSLNNRELSGRQILCKILIVISTGVSCKIVISTGVSCI